VLSIDRKAGAVSEGDLTISFVGERRTVDPSGTLTFGRAADLVVDDANPFLHRIVGRFSWINGLWWLENLGASIEVTVVGPDGTRIRLAPLGPDGLAATAPLATERFLVVFRAGDLPYELEGELHRSPMAMRPIPQVPKAERTSAYGQIELTGEERRLLLLLAEPVLRSPTAGPDSLPSNREVAARLDWPITKFNRKLDYLCTKLTRAGVRGLRGDRGAEATNRRWRLVELAISTRLVSVADLGADTYEGPTRPLDG
jgi:hypothetical protein